MTSQERAPQRVLVTGGASGLGAALVARYAARGDQVLVTDLSPTHQGPSGTSYLRLDVTSQDDWDAALAKVEEEWGGIDLLVNNAGIAAGGRIDVVPIEDWQRTLDVNLLGVVRGCRTFTPLLKRQGSGHLVNTASVAGLVHPPGMTSYAAAKAGVVALSESLRHELHPWGIQVSVVCPSFFRTNLASSLSDSDPLLTAIATRLIDRAPLTADQVAGEVVRAVDAGRHLVLTDAPGRRAYAAKRFARRLYDRQQLAFGARIRRAAEKGTVPAGERS